MFTSAGNTNQTSNVGAGGTVYQNGSCQVIALVVPSGAVPVSGSITSKVTVDASVQSYRSRPYGQRHYDIEPATNAANATATITLYYTQAEFNAFNLFPYNGPDLPTGPSDAAGKSNLRIYQYHGTSGTGLPGSYSGASEMIDPDDAQIVWNATQSRWEVTIDVDGFSGFFLGNDGNTILPVTWLQVSGILSAQKHAIINWQVQENQVATYELQKSYNGTSFVPIGAVPSKGSGSNSYVFNEPTELIGTAFYRIKQTDKNADVTYSRVVMLQAIDPSQIMVYPNPATDLITISVGADLLHSKATLSDIRGRVLQTITFSSARMPLRLDNLAPGTYLLKLENGYTEKIIKR
jgi:hypothetical protein